MKSIPQSYEPPNNELTAFPDGQYKVISFEWFSKDDKERPILVAQKNGQMVGRLRFTLEDGTEGPPMSLVLGQMGLLVKAFGGDTSKLPAVPELNQVGKVTQFMQKVKELSTGKIIGVTVSKGWVSSVEGMDILGLYYFKLIDISGDNSSGEVAPREGKWGQYFFAEFEIVAGEGGADTPFRGANFTEIINYAVVVKDDAPDWERTNKGDYTWNAKILARLMEATYPTMFEADHVVRNPSNLLSEWLENLDSSVVFKGYRGKNEKNGRIELNWATLENANFAGPITKQEVVAPVVSGDKETAARKLVASLLTWLAGQPATVGETFDLSEKGKEVARQHLSPLKKQGLISTGSIGALTMVDIANIFENVRVPDELKPVFDGMRTDYFKIARTDKDEEF